MSRDIMSRSTWNSVITILRWGIICTIPALGCLRPIFWNSCKVRQLRTLRGYRLCSRAIWSEAVSEAARYYVEHAPVLVPIRYLLLCWSERCQYTSATTGYVGTRQVPNALPSVSKARLDTSLSGRPALDIASGLRFTERDCAISTTPTRDMCISSSTILHICTSIYIVALYTLYVANFPCLRALRKCRRNDLFRRMFRCKWACISDFVEHT